MSGQLWRLCEHGETGPHVCQICGGTGYSSGSATLLTVSQARCVCVIPRCPGGHPVEGGEKVWWCLEHKSDAPHDKARCWYAVAKMNDLSGSSPSRCRMVERCLIPLPNTETTK